MRIGRFQFWLERKGTPREYFQIRRLRIRMCIPKENNHLDPHLMAARIMACGPYRPHECVGGGFDRYSIGPLHIVIRIGKEDILDRRHTPKNSHADIDKMYHDICGKSIDMV